MFLPKPTAGGTTEWTVAAHVMLFKFHKDQNLLVGWSWKNLAMARDELHIETFVIKSFLMYNIYLYIYTLYYTSQREVASHLHDEDRKPLNQSSCTYIISSS